MLTPLISTPRKAGSLASTQPGPATASTHAASRSASPPASPDGLAPRPQRALAPVQPKGPDFDETLAAQRKPHLLAYLRQMERELENQLERPMASDTNSDMHHLDDIMEALNATTPSLNLCKYAFEFNQQLEGLKKTGLVTQLFEGMQTQGQWHAIFDRDGKHRSAMSVQCAKDSASLVIVDSLPADSITEEVHTGTWTRVLEELQWFLDRKRNFVEPRTQLRAHIVFTHAQKSDEGCTIFALSAAKKMASSTAIADLHRQALASAANADGTEPAVKMLASSVLPPAFMKHATSARTLREYLEKRRQEPNAAAADQGAVNKRGETLLERHAAHEVTRQKRPPEESTWFTPILKCLGMDTGPKTSTYSASYLHKRIEFVRTALAHFAPPTSDDTTVAHGQVPQ
ncbi:YopJ serine/threonine acetyltransferase [Paracidovorax anthurii]|uniref:YopJ serine/threonine acetyltransferase n=2 Tax=Paracidovorax anthurii TaxID=78229 RepID=A0A328Z5E4_9BURK|nr:YopJ family acetyltransferase [Paracidovorax anthurii]RAR80653.1 YopJ serine/threonine acetyltransferase [Paracidovorax anthurii]